MQSLRQRFLTMVPCGTHLVLRTHPDDKRGVAAVSVLTAEDIIWENDPPLCTVLHRARSTHYNTSHSSLNQQRTSFILRVPIPLLLLECEWPCSTSSPQYTLYGCPRLVSGTQVCFASLLDASPTHNTNQPLVTWGNSMRQLRSGQAWYCARRRVSVVVLGFVAHSTQFHVRSVCSRTCLMI